MDRSAGHIQQPLQDHSTNGRALHAFEALQLIVAQLFNPEGCPRSRLQTHTILKPYLLEEATEVTEILDAMGDTPCLPSSGPRPFRLN